MDDLRNVIDTLLNVGVFAFIGILIWVYFRREPEGNEGKSLENGGEN